MVVERIGPEEIEKFKELREIFIEVFKENAPELNEEQYARLRDNRNFVAIGATVGFELVGGLTAHIIPNYYNGGVNLFIYDIAVKDEHQGKGVGSELLKFTKKFCEEHGIKEMFVATEEGDKDAIAYYRKFDLDEIKARFYSYKFST